jgi:hypothetical protein
MDPFVESGSRKDHLRITNSDSALSADEAQSKLVMRSASSSEDHANEEWLTRVLQEGQESGRIRLNEPAREAAQLIVSGLEGAMLIARPYDDVERFHLAATRLLTGLVSQS